MRVEVKVKNWGASQPYPQMCPSTLQAVWHFTTKTRLMLQYLQVLLFVLLQNCNVTGELSCAL